MNSDDNVVSFSVANYDDLGNLYKHAELKILGENADYLDNYANAFREFLRMAGFSYVTGVTIHKATDDVHSDY